MSFIEIDSSIFILYVHLNKYMLFINYIFICVYKSEEIITK